MPQRVSVSIPVYNGESFIRRAITSVLQQSYSDFELIVLNNCSTDRTAAVIQEFADPRLRVITHARNIGAEGNWNAALQAAQGHYIKVLCADDYLYPNCLAAQVAVLDDPAHAGVGLVTARRDIVTPQGKRLMTRGMPGSSRTLHGHEAIRLSLAGGTNLLGEPGSVLFRTDLLAEAGAFDISLPYVIDLDFWCRLLGHGDLFFIAEPLGAFTVSLDSWSADIVGKQAGQFCQFVDKAASRYLSLRPQEVRWSKWHARVNARVRQAFYWYLALTKS